MILQYACSGQGHNPFWLNSITRKVHTPYTPKKGTHMDDLFIGDNSVTFENIGKENVIPIQKSDLPEESSFMSTENIMKDTTSSIPHILYPWLPERGIAMVYAGSGIGKTLFALNVAYCIAGGGNFLSYKSPKPKKVLYIDAEMSFVSIKLRITDIVKEQGKLWDDSYFKLLNNEKLNTRLPKICNPLGQAYYNEMFEKYGFEVVVLDNLSMLTQIDENKAHEWVVVQDWLLSLRAKGITVIIVHHSGKNQTGYRGTSRMIDCMDTAISLQPTHDVVLESETTNEKKIKIIYQKNRTFWGKDACAMEASFKDGKWSYDMSDIKNSDRIIEMLKEGMKQIDIAYELNVSRAYVSKMKKKAVKTGILFD